MFRQLVFIQKLKDFRAYYLIKIDFFMFILLQLKQFGKWKFS